jgi:NAD(P)-dependent dehydrogenase (short-subunit alcohol dehydrogenase family)
MLLDEKSIVVTGSGSGVGRAAAHLFAREGARVVCADVRDDWAKETVRLIEAEGGTAFAQPCDVSKEDEVVAAIGAAVENFGRLDVMFNNAGISTPRPGMLFEDHTTEDWDRIMDVNLRGIFHGCKHAVITFKRQGGGGIILNTGSVAGMVGWGGTVYGTSKGGVNQLSRAIAVECAPFDIRVNCLCPAGMPDTNFMVHEAVRGSEGTDEQQAEAVGAMHPLGRPITAADCAIAALYLVSDQSKNVTGILLPIDGGYTAK